MNTGRLSAVLCFVYISEAADWLRYFDEIIGVLDYDVILFFMNPDGTTGRTDSSTILALASCFFLTRILRGETATDDETGENSYIS